MSEANLPAAVSTRPSLLWTGVLLFRRTGVFVAVHVGALCVLLTEPTRVDWAVLVVMLFVRAYVTSIGYHRYFSHRSFKMGRVSQFIVAMLCCTNLQNGPLWWAAVHRHHHRHSDDEHDYHSPTRGGFFWAHCGWLFNKIETPDWSKIRDLRRFPELVWLEHVWLLPAILMGACFWLAGGWSMVCLAFFLSALINMHGTFAVNSFGHLIGWRRYETSDTSTNSLFLACMTAGDGWHNNHHHYPHSANHGFFPGEIDGSYHVIRFLETLGLVWGLRAVPPHKLHPPTSPTPEEAVHRVLDAHPSTQATGALSAEPPTQ